MSVSDESSEKLLIEEQKDALEHIRFLETKRDRFVIGGVTASGVVLAFIEQALSKDGFRLLDMNVLLILILFILCFSLCVLSCFLRKAYCSLSIVIKHYEDVVAVTRQIIYGEEAERLIKIKTTEKALLKWLDPREDEKITKGRIPVSKLSERIL
jgi:hypothetical protein